MSSELDNKKSFVVSILGEDYEEAGMSGSNPHLRYCCPFCETRRGKSDSDYKLYVSIGKLVYWCHKCEATGYLGRSDYIYSESNSDGIKDLMNYLNNDSISADDKDSDYYLIPYNHIDIGSMAYEYLSGRGISYDDMIYYDMRVPSLGDKSNFGRVIIPNKVINNMWTDMYVGRSYVFQKNRYKNPPLSKKTAVVFNLHRIPKNPPRLIIQEGTLKAISGGRDNVATYGKYVSDLQLSLILSWGPKSIYCSLDGDASDLNEQLCSRITQQTTIPTFMVEMPIGVDSTDLGREAYMEYINKAKQYRSVKYYQIMKLFDIVSGDKS